MPAILMLKRDGARSSRLGRYLLSMPRLTLRRTRVKLPDKHRVQTESIGRARFLIAMKRL